MVKADLYWPTSAPDLRSHSVVQEQDPPQAFRGAAFEYTLPLKAEEENRVEQNGRERTLPACESQNSAF